MDEDYATGYGVQRGLDAFDGEEFVFGRNEPGVQHFHRVLKEMLRMSGGGATDIEDEGIAGAEPARGGHAAAGQAGRGHHRRHARHRPRHRRGVPRPGRGRRDQRQVRRRRAQQAVAEMGGGDRVHVRRRATCAPGGRRTTSSTRRVERYGSRRHPGQQRRRHRRLRARARDDRRGLAQRAGLEPQRRVLGHASARSATCSSRAGAGSSTSRSVEGKQGNKPAVSHYITNKHAINGLTKAVAFEYGTAGHHLQRDLPRRHRDRHHEGRRAGRRPSRPASPTSSSSTTTRRSPRSSG